MVFEDNIAIDGSLPNSKPTAADYTNQPKDGKTWKILKQQHDCYQVRALDVKKQDILYKGGFQMNNPEVAALFCPKLKNEEDTSAFKERVASASYTPTFSKLITGLISNLFSQDLAVMESADHDDETTLGDELTGQLRDFYKQFHNDCDGCGTNLHDFMRNSATKALIHSFNIFGVDYPKGEANNLLEQEQLGLDKPRLYRIDSNSVFDWQYKEDSDYEYQWVKILDCHPYQPTAFDTPMHQFIVKVWFLNEQGLAAYETYQSEPLPVGKEPKDKDVLNKIDEGITSFKSIPIIYFKLDDGVSVGGKLAPMAAEHFNRTTIENHSTNRACLTIPVVYRGELMPGGDGLPSPAGMIMNRGQHPRGQVNSKGVVELGSYTQDRLEIVEAEGKALSFIHLQNTDLDHKMHSVVHQMGESLKEGMSKSGKAAASKQEDRRATEMLLTTIADEIYGVVERVFTVIAESRGEEIVWDVKGLSATAAEDRDELVVEAGLLATLNMPSPTFMKEYHYRIASRLVDGTDQRTLQTIRAEIEDGLDKNPNIGVSGKPISQEDPAQKAPAATVPAKSDASTPKEIGQTGNAKMEPGSHIQTGEHVEWKVIYDILVKDYKPKDLAWVKLVSWRGPVEVNANEISMAGQEDWAAMKSGPQGQDKVDKFTEVLSDKGWSAFQPVILANMPHNDEQYTIIDGRHRFLAAQQANIPILAYIADVGSVDADTPHMQLHGKQIGANNSSGG